MDPAKLPTMAACGSNWDLGSATSAACGAAMVDVCSTGAAGPDGATLQSLLLSSVSNCANWRGVLQTQAALEGAASAPGLPYLDTAMANYCSGVGLNAVECGCLSFPTRAADWCNSGATCTSALWPPSMCPAREFMESTDNGAYIKVVQFSACNPYPCWLSDCYMPTTEQLLTSPILELQMTAVNGTATGCANVCGQVYSASTVSMNNGPMPPGSFDVNMVAITACGTATAAAMLVAPTVDWLWAVNSPASWILEVANDGDYPAAATVTSVTADMTAYSCTVTPAGNILFPGRSTMPIVITCDQDLLVAGMASQTSVTGYAGSATFGVGLEYLNYADSGTPTVYVGPLEITMTAAPPAGGVVIRTSNPPAWAITLMVALGVVIVLLLSSAWITAASIDDMLHGATRAARAAAAAAATVT